MGLDVLYCTEYSVHRSSIYHDPSISLLKVQQRHVTWHVTDTALIWHRQMLLPSFPPSPLATPTLGGSDDFPLGTPVWIRMLFLSLLYRTDVVVGTFLTSWQGTRTLPHSRQGSRYLSIWHDTRRERHLVRMRHLTSLLSSLLLSLRLDITCFFFFELHGDLTEVILIIIIILIDAYVSAYAYLRLCLCTALTSGLWTLLTTALQC